MKTCRVFCVFFLMMKFKNNFGNVSALEKKITYGLPSMVDLNVNQHL